MATRVVGYVRVSTEQQTEDGQSLEAQRAKIQGYCVAMDLNMVTLVADEGLSGKDLKRPGLTKALGLLESGEADGLLIVKLDRLTRSVKDLGELIEKYFAKKYSLLSVNDSIDTRTASGRLVLNVLTSAAQWEREACSERTKAVMAHIKNEGGVLGCIPLGYRRGAYAPNGHRIIEENPEELAVVRKICEMHTDGLSLREIATELSEQKIKTKRGSTKWTPTQVRRTLLGPGAK